MNDGTLLVIAFLGAAISAMVASGKNRNVLGYAALGFCLPLIGVIATCCLPPVGSKPEPQA